MQTPSFVKSFLRANNVASIVVKPAISLLFGLLFALAIPGLYPASVHAQAAFRCPGNAEIYLIRKGDTLSKIAGRYHTTWKVLAKVNQITNPNLIYAGNILCIVRGASGNEIASTATSSSNATWADPAYVAPAANPAAPVGTGNYFPYGQCTWWADERYYQLHGVYVPWISNSDAWLWTLRAQQFGWQVSSTPHIGDIIDLQANVQGAYSLGHVAVVEQILSNGDVIASNMNWGATPQVVTDIEFSPGAGVTFIHQ